jgi:hypothetical protein
MTCGALLTAGVHHKRGANAKLVRWSDADPGGLSNVLNEQAHRLQQKLADMEMSMAAHLSSAHAACTAGTYAANVPISTERRHDVPGDDDPPLLGWNTGSGAAGNQGCMPADLHESPIPTLDASPGMLVLPVHRLCSSMRCTSWHRARGQPMHRSS